MELKLKTVSTKLFALGNDGPILHVGHVKASSLKKGGSGTEVDAINKIHDIYYEYLYIFIYV